METTMSRCAYCGGQTGPRRTTCRAHQDLPRLDPTATGRLSTVGDKPVESEYPSVMSATPTREDAS